MPREEWQEPELTTVDTQQLARAVVGANMTPMPNTTVPESTPMPTPPPAQELVRNPNATQLTGRTKQKAQ